MRKQLIVGQVGPYFSVGFTNYKRIMATWQLASIVSLKKLNATTIMFHQTKAR
jgi:hypothetical protein